MQPAQNFPVLEPYKFTQLHCYSTNILIFYFSVFCLVFYLQMAEGRRLFHWSASVCLFLCHCLSKITNSKSLELYIDRHKELVHACMPPWVTDHHALPRNTYDFYKCMLPKVHCAYLLHKAIDTFEKTRGYLTNFVCERALRSLRAPWRTYRSQINSVFFDGCIPGWGCIAPSLLGYVYDLN